MKRAQVSRGILEGNRQAMNWLIWGGSLVTLFFWSNLNDPFNAPKSWILSIAGFWLIGWVIFQIKDQWKNSPLKWATIIAGAYFLALSAAFLATDNKYIGMFGDYQRRTGYLSYLCLIGFFLAASFLFNPKKLSALEIATVLVGFLVGVYGVAQHFKHDFVHWNNPYNPVLGTLGNPDFAAALMAIFAVLNFGILIQHTYVKWLRVIASLNVLVLFAAIGFSQVRQGLLASLLGIVLIAIVWLFQRNKVAGYGVGSLAVIVGSLGLFGMLNKGPLAQYFYKASVTYRGDYWRAGWRMFIDHPIFGVGLDRYGAYFRQYRDATQIDRRGPNLVSNAAHNVPIQLASTGGIFVLLAFLALTGFIFWRGILALRMSQGREQITIAVIFAAWLAYQAQSFISIDNLAIAIWGYILGGAVVGISLSPDKRVSVQQRDSILQPLISSVLALAFLALSALFFQSESAMKTLSSTQTPKSQSELSAYEAIAQKPLSSVFHEAAFSVTVAGDLAQANDLGTAVTDLQKVIDADPRFYDAMELLARIYEYQKNWPAAAQVRQKMLPLDPFNKALQEQITQDRNGGVTKSK